MNIDVFNLKSGENQVKYYVLKQDYTISVFPRLASIPSIDEIWSDSSAMYCKATLYKDKIGFCPLPLMTTPCFMISPDMKRIFEAYQIGAKSRLFAIEEPNGMLFYYFYQPPILDCVHESSQYNPDGSVKQLVLDLEKIGPHKIFQPAWLLENYLIVDMEILELLLCDGIYPFLFEEMKIKSYNDWR